MAFQSRDLSVIAYANGFTLWHFVTEDELSSVVVAGYFNRAADMLRKGDMLLLNSQSRADLKSAILTVSGNDGAVVKVETLAAPPA